MKADIYETITNQIIEAIERGAPDLEMPWNQSAGAFAPVNASTGKPYRGVNVLALWAAASKKGYATGEWATYKQWSDMGAQVRKDEKSSHIVFWSTYEKNGPGGESDADANDAEKETGMFAKAYFVFNADQVDGYTPKAAAVIDPAGPGERIPECDAFFSNLGMNLKHGGEQAYFSPTGDYVQMPPFEVFKSVEGYYSTLAHEATHWTGHKPRLDRDMTGRFGNAKYAMEELVAELGAAFTMSNIGFGSQMREDHASYIQTWLKALKDDKKAIFTASSKAQQAADFMLGLQSAPAPEITKEAASHYESAPCTIGKTDWKVTVLDSSMGHGRVTDYLFRAAGSAGPWQSSKDHPKYDINDGTYGGLPKGLVKIYDENRIQIDAALQGRPVPPPQQIGFSF